MAFLHIYAYVDLYIYLCVNVKAFYDAYVVRAPAADRLTLWLPGWLVRWLVG